MRTNDAGYPPDYVEPPGGQGPEVARAHMVSSDGTRYHGSRRPTMLTNNYTTDSRQTPNRLEVAGVAELPGEVPQGYSARTEYDPLDLPVIRQPEDRRDSYDASQRRRSTQRGSRNLVPDATQNGTARMFILRGDAEYTRNSYGRSSSHERMPEAVADPSRQHNFRGVRSAESAGKKQVTISQLVRPTINMIYMYSHRLKPLGFGGRLYGLIRKQHWT